tara:strand:- start:140 stop:385 length:246 start_codon:yes stop_codon:yes gene_type:complete
MSFFSPSGSYLKDARSNTPRVQNEPVSAQSVSERPRVTDSSGRDVTNTKMGRAAGFLSNFIKTIVRSPSFEKDFLSYRRDD